MGSPGLYTSLSAWSFRVGWISELEEASAALEPPPLPKKENLRDDIASFSFVCFDNSLVVVFEAEHGNEIN